MSKYIDADKLIAEIERLLARANRRTDKEHLSHNSEMEKFGEDYWNGYGDLAYSLLGFITSLQQEQPDVDLDALVNEAFDKYSSVDGYGQLSVSFNRAELYQFIKRMSLVFNARNEE